MKTTNIVCGTIAMIATFMATFAMAQGTVSATAGTASGVAVKTLPLAEARGMIKEVTETPAKMTEIMRQLSPEDQKSFLGEVNVAVSKLPGSAEEKAAKFLNINRAALSGGAEGFKADVIATTFATVPPESLTVISERYAVDLFARDADPSRKFDDATYARISSNVVAKVMIATTGSDDSAVRNTLAILMFVRGSNNQAGLADTLVSMMPEDEKIRKLAKDEWIPAALAEGKDKSYEDMMAYADASQPPAIEIVLNLAGPQILDAALVDITSGMDDKRRVETTPVLDQNFGGFEESRIYMNDDTTAASMRIKGNGAYPRTQDPTKPWNPDYRRGDDIKKPLPPIPEPEPYPYCDLGL